MNDTSGWGWMSPVSCNNTIQFRIASSAKIAQLESTCTNFLPRNPFLKFHCVTQSKRTRRASPTFILWSVNSRLLWTTRSSSIGIWSQKIRWRKARPFTLKESPRSCSAWFAQKNIPRTAKRFGARIAAVSEWKWSRGRNSLLKPLMWNEERRQVNR